MPPKLRTTGDDGENLAPSREEIETLCILHAIGSNGTCVNDLTTLLGLSPALASAVAEAVAPLIIAGWVDLQDEELSLTDAGIERLRERLSEFIHRK